MRAALYTREAPEDGKTVDGKRKHLQKFCKQSGWVIVTEITEESTDAARAEDCPGLSRLFISASLREFDVVVIYSMNDFTRPRLHETFKLLARLKKMDVDVCSATEPHFRTAGEAGQQLLKITEWIGTHETTTRSRSIKAALVKKREQGKRLGRPAANVNVDAVRTLKAQGNKADAIAEQLGISRSLVYEVLKGDRE